QAALLQGGIGYVLEGGGVRPPHHQNLRLLDVGLQRESPAQDRMVLASDAPHTVRHEIAGAQALGHLVVVADAEAYTAVLQALAQSSRIGCADHHAYSWCLAKQLVHQARKEEHGDIVGYADPEGVARGARVEGAL